ncbi:MAG TPA: hypothetical protein VE961_13515 [Pyrinomonadaceae bacterium]|nr:hypothetical protein [Pyrinomonadaceae bacterium]
MIRLEGSEKHLSVEFRSDLRYFAFFVANRSLFASGLWNRYGFEYTPSLLAKNNVFGQLFSVFVNVWQPVPLAERATLAPPLNPNYRAEQYLMSHVDPNYHVVPEFEPREVDIGRSELPWKQCVKEFSITLGNGNLEPELLGDIDYLPRLFDFGSNLEAVYAVFSNVLMIDTHGNPTNTNRAYFRAAQCVRRWCVPGYEEEPPFQAWEVELH